MYRVEELHPLRVRVIEDFADGIQPDLQLVVFFDYISLVAPVGSEPLLGDLIHPTTTDLYFDPLRIRAQYREVQGLVTVPLRSGEPVAQAVGAVAVDLRDGRVDVPATVLLGIPILAVKDDTHGEEVIDFLKGNTLNLHLTPDREASLDTRLHLVAEAHRVKACLQWCSEAMEEILTTSFALLHLALDLCIGIGVLVAEAEVLQLGLDGEEPEAVGQRCVEEGGLTCDLKLLVGLHRAERAHVVQAVGDLDEDHTGIITDSQ